MIQGNRAIGIPTGSENRCEFRNRLCRIRLILCAFGILFQCRVKEAFRRQHLSQFEIGGRELLFLLDKSLERFPRAVQIPFGEGD